MENFGSKSHKETRKEVGNGYNNDIYNGHYKTSSSPKGMQDLRCYSASYASSSASAQYNGQMDIVVAEGGGGGGGSGGADQWKFKKGKSTNGAVSRSWTFNDPELQRKKRVASYKAYTVEGKVKGSFKKSFRWLKERYSQMLYGHR
ncbi:hypothetical protein ACJIZ3_021335 [Penstemon smallii]|uniref:DUF3511 domain protein n=1 Tax=Penstemon smallii TaxID=265156 RepID=A0ABD3SL43_9LAMI